MSAPSRCVDRIAGRARRARRARGFTLIELMIVLVIGLVLGLVMMNVMTFFEGSKRTSTSVNDVDNAGAAAVQQLDFALRGAGAGFTQTNTQSYGCTLFAARNGTTVLPLAAALPDPFGNVLGAAGINGPIRLAPVVILKNNTSAANLASANGTSDVLMIMAGGAAGGNAGAAGAGNGGATGMPVAMTAAPAAAALTVQNSAAFAKNDILLLTDDATATGRANCMLAEVASAGFAPPAAALPLAGSFYSASISGGSAGTATVAGLTVDAQPVAIGNMANTDGGNANASDNVPQFQLIGVGNRNSPTLYAYDLLSPNAAGQPAPLGDSVIEIHALYGLDTNGDNIVDTWQDPGTGNFTAANLLNGSEAAAANLLQIKAIRLAVILRSALVEKAAVQTTAIPYFANVPCAPGDATCTTGTTGKFAQARALSTTTTPSEQNFRYRTVELTIPIRNTMLICSSNC